MAMTVTTTATTTTHSREKVASGDASVECFDGNSEPVDFETLFKLRLSDKLDKLFADDKDLNTQFVLVPSLRDVFHEFVYPQVPSGHLFLLVVHMGQTTI